MPSLEIKKWVDDGRVSVPSLSWARRFSGPRSSAARRCLSCVGAPRRPLPALGAGVRPLAVPCCGSCLRCPSSLPGLYWLPVVARPRFPASGCLAVLALAPVVPAQPVFVHPSSSTRRCLSSSTRRGPSSSSEAQTIISQKSSRRSRSKWRQSAIWNF